MFIDGTHNQFLYGDLVFGPAINSSHFLVGSSGFSLHTVRSPANKDNFTSSFLICTFSFLCFIELTWTSSMIANRCDESGPPCLLSHLRDRKLSFTAKYNVGFFLPPSFLPLLFLSLPPFFVFFLECSFLYLCLLRFLSWKGIKFCQMLIFLVILYFVNVVNYIVSFQMLSQLCLPQINPAWSLCTTGLNLLIFCWKLTFLFMMNIEV